MYFFIFVSLIHLLHLHTWRMCENGNWFGRNLYDKIMMEYDYSDQLKVVNIEKYHLNVSCSKKLLNSM